MRPRTPTLLLAVVGGLTLVVACSSDEAGVASDAEPTSTTAPQDDTPDTSAATAPMTSSICATWVEVDAVSSALGGPEVPPEAAAAVAAELLALLDGLDDSPAELEAQVATARESVAAAADGDPSLLEGEEMFGAITGIGQWVHDECGFEQVDILYTEYEFGGVPTELPSGPTSFQATSGGEEAHVLLLGRINDGVEGDAEALVAEALSAGGDPEAALAEVATPVVAGAFAAPGETGRVTAELEAGSYVLYCPIPKGFTGEGPPALDAPSHAQEGMVAAFTVG